MRVMGLEKGWQAIERSEGEEPMDRSTSPSVANNVVNSMQII